MSRLLFLLLCFLFPLESHAQRVIWEVPTKGQVVASPVSDGENIYIGSRDHTFYAINPSDGKIAWQFDAQRPIRSTAAIDDNKIAFLADGMLYVLNKANGSLLFTFETQGNQRVDRWDYYDSSPVIHDGRIYFGSGDHHIYAVDLASGDKIWAFETGGVVHARPAIAGSNLYIGSFDGYFYALHLADGSLKWKFDTIGHTYFTKGAVQRGAIIQNGKVYFGSRDFNLYVLDAEKGHGRWNFMEPGSWVIATPTLFDQKVYFGSSDSHRFQARDARNGRFVWELPLNMRVYGSAAVSASDSTLYFGCFNGKLYVVDANTGKLNWTWQAEASEKHYSEVYDSKDHFREDFQLYSNDPEANEKAEQTILSLGSILSTPLLVDNLIIFGSTDGKVYALRAPYRK
jgi:outer membrane protein assembly factor BamB